MSESEPTRIALADLPPEVVDLLVLRVSQWLTQADKTDVPAELVPLAGFRPGHRHRDRRARATLVRCLTTDETLAPMVSDWLNGEKGPGPEGKGQDTDEIGLAWLSGEADVLADLLAGRHNPGDSATSDSDRVLFLEKKILVLEKRIGDAQEELTRIRHQDKRKSGSRRERFARLSQELADSQSLSNRLSGKVHEFEEQLSALKTKLTDSVNLASKRESNYQARIRSLESELEQTRRDRSEDRRSSRYLERLDVARVQVLLSAAQSAIVGLSREIPVRSTDNPAAVVRSNEAPTNPLPRRPGSNQLGDWLVVPGLHLLVDGYNVTKAATPDLPLAQQRELLIGRLCALAARTDAEVTVVFDAQYVNITMPSASRKGARVIFTDEGEIADDVLVDLVSAEPPGRAVMVITSDQELSSRVMRLGARAVPSEEFNTVLDKG